MSTTASDLLAMSDEEISNLSEPPVIEEKPADPSGSDEGSDTSGAVDEPNPAVVEEPTIVAEPDPATNLSDDELDKLDTPPADKAKEAEEAPEKKEGDEANPEKEEPKPGEVVADPKASGTGADKPNQEAAPVIELTVDDKAKAFDQIMAPLKANGKTIELRDPAEAIQLMQMGANYTKKLQQLQPHRKTIMMLENNGLLDPGKLSFLIDLEKGEPEAIKKLLKDKGINPLEIDTDVEPTYLGGSHEVSDAEVGFKTALDELTSTPAGSETLREINTGWDQASKEVLWESPETMAIIHTHRESGIYDLIKAEVDRQTTLGHIPANTPFLTAYKTVGDAMAQAATAQSTTEQQTEKVETVVEPQILDTRVATPKKQIDNGDRASAASPTRSSSKTAEVKSNPLAMSDEEFLKQMEGRL